MADIADVDDPRQSGAVPLHGPRESSPIVDWLLQEAQPPDGPYERDRDAAKHKHPWWQVVCLTGVDYFSSLGYAPGIAAVAAGFLSPVAMLVLVIVTLFGALPMYRRVAGESPHGDGSVSMLERLLPWWGGKLFVLCLIGFVSTGFVITITLSAADAAAHVSENPLVPPLHGHNMLITLVLIVLLGGVFLRGFTEAISIAVVLVVAYLSLNLVVVADAFWQIVHHGHVVSSWRTALFHRYSNPLAMAFAAVTLFPKLALGLSGFETGVLVMPLIRGDPNDDPERPAGRIRNGRKLLTAAACIMSVYLITSTIVTILLIPLKAFQEGGPASGRALAYLAHTYLGNGFGTVYDISTISILWFAGASAMAGLLNIVPRYLPRYGMAPDWARATRPLTIIVTAVAIAVTFIFNASVDAQAGAYATGVLAIMTSATIAVTLSTIRRHQRIRFYFAIVAVVFIYTLLNIVLNQTEGLKISLFFIAVIIVVSLISRVFRSTELRVRKVEFDETAMRFIQEAAQGTIRIIGNHPDQRDTREYLLKEREQREDNHIPPGEPVLFLEVTVCDASDFAPVLEVHGEDIGGYRVLRVDSAHVPNTMAAIALRIRDITGKRPHIYLGWTEGNPLKHLAKYILFGEGDIAPVTREVLRQAERDPQRRPAVHVG